MWKPSITPGQVIMHSQGPWEEHKYVKKEGDKYFYPESYEGGRHASSEDSSSSTLKRYSADDKDFDDKNYSPKNLLGDTNFYGFVTKDGRTVILQEDVKWELPAGKKIDKKLIARLEAFDKEIERRRNAGEKIGSDEWERLASEAVSGSGAKKTSSKKSASSRRSSSSSGSKSSKSSNGSSSKEMSDRERRAKNRQTMKARTEEQRKNKEERMKRNKLKGKAYLNHSFWAPTEDYLIHHGIEGQRWGKRNGPPYPLDQSQKSQSEKKYRTDKGYKKNRRDSKKKTSKMSNNELRREIERKELEQRYNDLNDAQINRGKQKTMEIIKDYAMIAGAVATTVTVIEKINKMRKFKK